jgi:hypothetical protein
MASRALLAVAMLALAARLAVAQTCELLNGPAPLRLAHFSLLTRTGRALGVLAAGAKQQTVNRWPLIPRPCHACICGAPQTEWLWPTRSQDPRPASRAAFT